MIPRTGLAVGLSILALSLAACGDDEAAQPASETTGTGSTTSAATEATTTTETGSTTTTGTDTTTTTSTGDGSGGVGPGPGGEASSTPCPGAESPPNIVNVTSFGTDCGAVEAAMAELRAVRRSFRIGDFDCERVSGSRYGGTWNCLGEASYFSFDFAD